MIPNTSQRNSPTVEREEYINRWLLWRKSLNHSCKWFALPEYEFDRLLGASFEEKDAYYRAAKKKIYFTVLAITTLWLCLSVYLHLNPVTPLPAQAKPTFEAAGIVQEIHLHSTTFSTQTTLKTSTGIFQVRGGVSAATGDSVQIKRVIRAGLDSSEVCIASKIKADCYPIM